MRVALINPPWSFDGSIYFGCREPHLPLELAYSERLLREAGHKPRIFDCHASALSLADLQAEVSRFRPGMTVVATAPTYLFWRCAPPELRVPLAAFRALRETPGLRVAVGPHGSATPRPVHSPDPFTGRRGPRCGGTRGHRPAVRPDREMPCRSPGRASAIAASALVRASYRRRHQPPLSPR